MPGHDYILNSQRESNPFTPTTKPVWLERPTNKVSRDMKRTLVASEIGTSFNEGFSPSSSYAVTAHHSRKNVDASDVGGDRTRGYTTSMMASSNTKMAHQTAFDEARSRAPSIPRKPAPLRSESFPFPVTRTLEDMLLQKREPVRSPVSPTSARSTSSGSPRTVSNPPKLPQCGDRCGFQSLSVPIASSMQAIDALEPSESHVTDAPAPPPRRQGSTDNLMDETDSRVGRMDAWKPLQPD